LNANQSRFDVAATGTFERVEVVIRLVRPFNSDQAIRQLASQASRQGVGFRFRLICHLARACILRSGANRTTGFHPRGAWFDATVFGPRVARQRR